MALNRKADYALLLPLGGIALICILALPVFVLLPAPTQSHEAGGFSFLGFSGYWIYTLVIVPIAAAAIAKFIFSRISDLA